jgi:hypothetical protein
VSYYEGLNRKFPDKEIVSRLIPYCEKYIKVQPEITSEARKIRKSWGDNILGLHRGTDMKSTPDHPIPP